MINIILSLAGSVLLILLGIIGYFLKRLVLAIEVLRMDFNDFSKEFSVQENELKNLKEVIKDRNETVDKRLEKHSDRMDEIEKEISFYSHCKNAQRLK